MTTHARLILARTVPGSVMADYASLFEHLVAAPQARSKPWLVVPSLQRRFPFPAANSPPWQLEAALRALHGAGVRDVTVWLPPRDYSLHVYADLVARYGASLTATPEMAGQPHGLLLLPTLSRGPRFALGGSCWLAHQLISAGAGSQGAALDSVLAVQQLFEPIICLMDATTVGNGPPGRTTQPEVGNFLLGANDMTVLDRFACTLLDIDPAASMPFVLEAARLTGAPAPQAVLAGDRELAVLRFRPHRSRRYHIPPAFHRWPSGDQRVYTAWLYETAWGRLFASYYQPRPGVVAKAF
ncbi:MAG TPA: hypothetical protein VFT99_15560 [Roseiflexaceae bacterium]|nr:hypothetical protein [Roseiflexaceae bacterium]